MGDKMPSVPTQYVTPISDTERHLVQSLIYNNLPESGIVFNVAGCLIRWRRRWSVTYTSGRFPNLEFGIEGHFRREKILPVSWQDEKHFLYCPGQGANPRPPAHITPRLHNKQGVPYPLPP